MSNSMRPHGLHVALQASLSVTSSQSLLTLTSVELVIATLRLSPVVVKRAVHRLLIGVASPVVEHGL